MESYAKYADMERMQTCLLIDEPPVILLGRTFSELVTTMMAFVGFAYFGMPVLGIGAAVVLGGAIPIVRLRYPRGFLAHFGWSLGILFPEVAMFTLSRMLYVMGP
jgi:hypothetical protein